MKLEVIVTRTAENEQSEMEQNSVCCLMDVLEVAILKESGIHQL